MYYITKISSAEAIDYAALELKKYLGMMMPEGGDIKISQAPHAECGFRLGLMQDFGLDVSDAEDVELDDIIYIDCNEEGGIIAGDNPRSVLIAVYEYLRRNGCRWLYPGIDGEYIPVKNIEPVTYRHKPILRCRGYATEGAMSQDAVLKFLDFMPKLGLNTFMIEFRVPRTYYKWYYVHGRNQENRTPESISDEQVVQWKRQMETELAKRGLLYHAIGHGWTVDPFGIDSKYTWEKLDESVVPTDMVKYLAEVKGKRGLFEGVAANTQFCMSNPEARRMFVECVIKYAQKHTNIDYLHVWLADSINNHCECAECQKKSPSDYYVILMNELDRALTEKKIATKVALIAYLDTIYPPTTERIENPDRFILLLAPISRSYASTYPAKDTVYEVEAYKRNDCTRVGALAHNMKYYEGWKEKVDSDGITFEYHFWKHLTYDLTGLQMARRVFEDVAYYREKGIKGILENGTMRPFFPNGIAFYTYARSMYDETLSFDEISTDYYSHIYGSDYQAFVDYFEKLNKIFPYHLLAINADGGGMKKNLNFEPGYVKILETLDDVLENGAELISTNFNSDVRVQTVSVRLLEKHQKYMRLLRNVLCEKSMGNNEEAAKHLEEFRTAFGKEEINIEPYFDHFVIFGGWMQLFTITSNPYIT